MNWYAYAYGNPVLYVDPYGLLSLADVGAWIDSHILGGAASRYGYTAGLHDAGQASDWELAKAGANFGYELATAATCVVGAEAKLASAASKSKAARAAAAAARAARAAADFMRNPPGWTRKWKKGGTDDFKDPQGRIWHRHPAGPSNPHGPHWDMGKHRYYPDGTVQPK